MSFVNGDSESQQTLYSGQLPKLDWTLLGSFKLNLEKDSSHHRTLTCFHFLFFFPCSWPDKHCIVVCSAIQWSILRKLVFYTIKHYCRSNFFESRSRVNLQLNNVTKTWVGEIRKCPSEVWERRWLQFVLFFSLFLLESNIDKKRENLDFPCNNSHLFDFWSLKRKLYYNNTLLNSHRKLSIHHHLILLVAENFISYSML